jgi:electron transport complex protein RnfG
VKDSGFSFHRSALSLGLVAIIGTTLLSGVNHLTAERIAEQERRVVLEQLGQIISPDRYDNELQDDWFAFSDEASFPQGQRVVAYRARRGGQPVAVILRFAAVDGYNGHIGLLAGIEADGRLAGVRVSSHRQPPGLGDAK